MFSMEKEIVFLNFFIFYLNLFGEGNVARLVHLNSNLMASNLFLPLQVWFQNRRCKIRRKNKELQLRDSQFHDHHPSYTPTSNLLWQPIPPVHLPFPGQPVNQSALYFPVQEGTSAQTHDQQLFGNDYVTSQHNLGITAETNPQHWNTASFTN